MPSQSVPTILVLKTRVGLWPEKQNWAPCFLKKAVCKKPRSLLFKKRRGNCFLLPIFDLIFFWGHKPTHVFKTRIVGTDWLGDYVSLSINYIFMTLEKVINQSELCDWSMIFYIYNLTFVLVFIVVTLDATPHHNIFDLIFLSSTALQSRKNEVDKRSSPKFKSSKKTTTKVRHSRICGFSEIRN